MINFGTALVSKLGLKDKRIIIIGENTYHWYVSYMAMLCGVGIAVPVDKELPENEIENVIKRSKASAVIYSTKKQETIKKIQEKIPEVQYFIQMNSETEINERNVGMNYLIEQGKQIVGQGDNSFINITGQGLTVNRISVGWADTLYSEWDESKRESWNDVLKSNLLFATT